MDSLDLMLASQSANVDSLVATFGGHEGMDRPHILHWLRQFDAEHVPLAVKILDNVRYFTRPNIIAMTREIVQDAYALLSSLNTSRILFLSPGSPWEGDSAMARALRREAAVPLGQLAGMANLPGQSAEDWDAVVICKDFAGTGRQLTDWWLNTGEMVILPLEARIVFAVLVLNDQACCALGDLGYEVICAAQLGQSDNVFHPSCVSFTDTDKQIIASYCERTRAPAEFVRGWGENALLVAFHHGCPNNSLPILWHGSEAWTPFFKRRAL